MDKKSFRKFRNDYSVAELSKKFAVETINPGGLTNEEKI